MTDRIGRLRDAVAAAGAEAAIISHFANRHYLSGYPAEDHAPDESYGVLVVTPDTATLYTSSTNLPWASATVRPPVVAREWERPWQPFIGEQLLALGVRTVAFEDRALSVADHAAIVGAAPGLEFIPVGNRVHAIRAVKDGEEIAAIAEAARITDEAFAGASTGLTAGITEKELAWRLASRTRELGADGLAFPTSVAAGPNGARPHHDPSDRPIEAGEPIIIDMGARIDGYCADLTRTIVIGEPPPLFRERYNTVLAANVAALSGIRAGMTGREADSIARNVIVGAGLEELILHGLGHGVGLLIHESPSLAANSDDVLKAGHIITVEPGIYQEGWGGIRIEDLCVVTSKGLQILSSAPK